VVNPAVGGTLPTELLGNMGFPGRYAAWENLLLVEATLKVKYKQRPLKAILSNHSTLYFLRFSILNGNLHGLSLPLTR
jgi:hypothetical protein